MNKNLFYFFSFLLFVSFSSFSGNITSNGTGGGNWSVGSTWIGGVAPASGDNAIIALGDVVTVTTSTAVTNITLNGGNGNTTLQINAGITLTASGAITINPPTGGNNDNTLAIGNGVLICASLTTTNSGNNTRRCLVTINTGTLTCSGSFAMANNTTRNKLTFTSNGLLQLGNNSSTIASGQLTASTGTIEYNMAGAQSILDLNYNTLKCSGSGIKTLTANTTLTGNVKVAGTTQLDVDATHNYDLNVAGDWNITSTNADPFLEQTGLVTLNGTSGTQNISTVLASGETFYDLTTTNTSVTNPGLQLMQAITITARYNQTGTSRFDLRGNSFNMTGSPASTQISNFTSGSIISSTSPCTISITDVNTKKSIYFSGTNFGDIDVGINITCTSNDSYFNGGIFYGTVNFTKAGTGNNDCTGGCTFYGPCTFNTTAAGDRWRMGNTNPDIFYNATFNHYCTDANSNFIVSRQTLNNQFYGTTTIYSESPGGFYIGRSNTSSNGSSNFHGPVYITAAKTGNIKLAESNGSIQNSVTFEDIIQLNSTNTSTGDIFIGTANQSTVTVTNTGRFIAGNILGSTNVYLYNITQTGTTYTQTINSSAASASTLYLGNTIGCSFGGSTNFSFPLIRVANNTFNGPTNVFTFTGNTNGNTTSNGNNTFGAATTTTITATGSGAFYLGTSSMGGDAFNGDITFVQTGSGALVPAYNATSTFGGNISTAGSITAITFGGAGSSNVTINGSGAQVFSGSASFIPIITNLTINKPSQSLTLNVPVTIISGGSLTMTSGKIITTATNILELLDESVTTTIGNASSYVDGPLRYDVTTTTTQALNFPIGKSADWRPAVLTIKNAVATQYNYTGEVFNADPFATFGSVPATDIPATVDTISGVHYWNFGRTDAFGASQPSANLSYNAGVYPLIQLYFGTNDFVYQGSKLTIVKNTNATPATWIDIGGTCALGNFNTPQAGNVTSTSTPTAFNSFSAFSLGSLKTGWNSLPIELLEFNAIPNDTRVDIKWSTSTETNNDYFTIEKSKDGRNFTKLVDVKGAGNSTSLKEYFDIDPEPYIGTSYYRLKQTDKNGAYKYFNMVPVTFNGNKNITVYPNPIRKGESLMIQVTGYPSEEVLVVLRDISGKEFSSKVLITEESNHIFSVSTLSEMPAGTYLVVASSNNKIYSYKLVVQ